MPSSADKISAHRPNSSSKFERVWKRFNQKFKTEEDCIEALYKILLQSNGLKCRRCENSSLRKERGSRLATCLTCNKESSITAGTFFDGIRVVRPWMAAIWLMENGVVVSANQFHKLLGVAYSTAWTMQRKIALVLQSFIDSEESAVLVASDLFAPLFCKRSRETPSKKHPSCEQEELERQSTKDHQQAGEFHTCPNGLIEHIGNIFHGISRKYLQTYLATIWCTTERLPWKKDCLLAACSSFPPIKYSDLLLFNSPLLVKLISRDSIRQMTYSEPEERTAPRERS